MVAHLALPLWNLTLPESRLFGLLKIGVDFRRPRWQMRFGAESCLANNFCNYFHKIIIYDECHIAKAWLSRELQTLEEETLLLRRLQVHSSAELQLR